MKRVRRPPTIEGMDVEEFIRQNADPIFLHEEGLWWMTEDDAAPHPRKPRAHQDPIKPVNDEDDLPF
jgi:hypothetical protein